MAKKTLGRIFPVPEGEYSASKTYKELSIVTYNGNSYICKKQSSGNDPTNTTYWQLMASKGERGERGEQGAPGASGTSGGSSLSSEQLEKLNNSIAIEDRAINNCNEWLSNGYVKTSTTTTNLPAKCTGSDRYGILFFIAENLSNHTGTQMYYPIDGTYKGRIFTRAIANGTPSEWNLISNFDGDYNNLTNKPVAGAKTYDKYVVVCVAGQSNAVGYDESPIETNFTYKNLDTNRIKQLGFYGNQNLQIIDLGYCAQNMQDMRKKSNGNPIQDKNGVVGTKGIHLPLANLMLDYIPEDYGILVLPIAFGGTGFTGSATTGTYNKQDKKPNERGQGEGTSIQRWGVGTAYYQTLRDRIIHALTLNEANLFAGIVWCQGENDQNDAAGHKTGFENMTAELFRELNAYNSGSLKKRVPKGEWDRDIWYNMETVYDWYNRNQCKTIWNNYKEWNPKTYVEIKSTNADSNETNGTRATANNLADHYGNNAYYRIIAPKVLQKMIDMNTFGKKTVVVEQECTGGTGGGSSYAVATEGTRLVKNNDIVTERTVDFTINDEGKCTANVDTLKGTFFKNQDKTQQPGLIFGDIYKMDWKVKRGTYWLVLEGDLNGNYLVLGLGKNSTGQLTKCLGTSLDPNTYGKISVPVDSTYTFNANDRIRVYRNPSDNSVSIYKTTNGNGKLTHWFDCPAKNAYEQKVLGFVCGIAGTEFDDGGFGSDANILFDDMKIQKQELFPNNKIIDLQLEEMAKAIADARA